MNSSYIFKYIIIGDTAVGKSSILLRFTNNQFQQNHDYTIGVDYGTKTLTLADNTTIKIQIWDTAGHECYRSITRSYYRDVAGVFLVYDITNRDTFSRLSSWLDELRQNNSNRHITIMLVGTKIDLTHRRQVKTSEGQEFANKHGLLFAECSPKLENTKINAMFVELTETINTKFHSLELDTNVAIYGIKEGTLKIDKKYFNKDEPTSMTQSSRCYPCI